METLRLIFIFCFKKQTKYRYKESLFTACLPGLLRAFIQRKVAYQVYSILAIDFHLRPVTVLQYVYFLQFTKPPTMTRYMTLTLWIYIPEPRFRENILYGDKNAILRCSVAEIWYFWYWTSFLSFHVHVMHCSWNGNEKWKDFRFVYLSTMATFFRFLILPVL